MNKQRRYVRNNQKKEYVETKLLYMKGKKFYEINDKVRFDLTRNRSCYFSPDTRDAEQITDFRENHERSKYNSVWKREQTVRNVEVDVQKTCNLTDRVSSPYYIASEVQSRSVRNVCVPDSNDDFSVANGKRSVHNNEDTDQTAGVSKTLRLKDIYISEEPRVKVIAEKFARYKINNVEVRKLEARIACMEYDVFQRGKDDQEPVQTMRAYFSVTPINENEKDKPHVAPTLARDHGVVEDLKTESEKGIEIIDAKIPDNKSLLDGLRRVLKNKQIYRIKKNKTLDAMYLYQMAMRDALTNECPFTDFLSKAELDEIKDLIIKKTTSSAHGISRRKFRTGNGNGANETKSDCSIKDDLINDLFKFM